MVYQGDTDPSKKPDKVYLQNPNLLQAISQEKPSNQALYETFFLNQLNKDYTLQSNGKDGEFLVNGELLFKIGNNKRITGNAGKTFIAADMEEVGLGNKVPLWLFGFLY
jgi:hypothetical protein